MHRPAVFPRMGERMHDPLQGVFPFSGRFEGNTFLFHDCLDGGLAQTTYDRLSSGFNVGNRAE